jgi:hypothetical protein
MSMIELMLALNLMNCTPLDDFTAQSDLSLWYPVNDGVMGGRSEGKMSLTDGDLVFEGVLNTNGGGFASIRRRVPKDAMAGAAEIEMELEGDGRGYELILQSDETFRGRAVTYRAQLTGAEHDEPAAVRVPLQNLRPTVFGRSVKAAPFDPAKASEIGIMLADGQDGPFRLKVSRLSVCAPRVTN